MKFYIESYPSSATDVVVRFRGEVPLTEIETLNLDPVERALLHQPGEGAANHLLVLAMLFRRWEAQQRAEAESRE